MTSIVTDNLELWLNLHKQRILKLLLLEILSLEIKIKEVKKFNKKISHFDYHHWLSTQEYVQEIRVLQWLYFYFKHNKKKPFMLLSDKDKPFVKTHIKFLQGCRAYLKTIRDNREYWKKLYFNRQEDIQFIRRLAPFLGLELFEKHHEKGLLDTVFFLPIQYDRMNVTSPQLVDAQLEMILNYINWIKE